MDVLYQHLAEKLPSGNTSHPILEPHSVPGLFFSAFFPRHLTGDFDKPGPWFLHTLETQNPSTRVHPRSEEMDAQMYYSDGRAA